MKNSKTFFVLPSQFNGGYDASTYKELLDAVWTVNSVEVITENEIVKNLEVGNVFLRFKSKGVTVTRNMGSSQSYGFNYFKLGIVNKIKKEKNGSFTWWEDFCGVVFFTADVNARVNMIQQKDTIYGDLLDYRLGYIKNYLQQLNASIKESISYDIYDDFYDDVKIKDLKQKSLYIPENILYGYNAFTGKEREKSAYELFKDYTNNYEVIPVNDLNDKLLDEQEDKFYYLMYHQKNNHKIITIVEGNSGEIIYRRHTKMSYNIKSKDLKTLDKRINKS